MDVQKMDDNVKKRSKQAGQNKVSKEGELTKYSKSVKVRFTSAEGNSVTVNCNHIQSSLYHLSEAEQKRKSGLFTCMARGQPKSLETNSRSHVLSEMG